jgi:plasmid maintenance system antidote protein VapI
MAKTKPTDCPVSTVLKLKIKESGRTWYRIAKDIGVEPDVISRFIKGQRGLRLDTVDRLAAYFHLKLSAGEH